MEIKQLILGFLIFAVSGMGSLYAQQVQGNITDEDTGDPLPGVNIIVKGTTTGTSSGVDGSYQLTVPSLSDTLVFSFIGFQTQEIPINGQTEIDVALIPEAVAGEELVVVGYGTQRANTVTGSISSIKTEEIKQSPAANLNVSLAGRLPGLTSIQTTGEPGRDATLLYLRGRGTTNGQNPLVLVDGVERDLNYIDPNEVEDITILKDASSTAMFGVRGANGVVLVTTKRGKRGKPEIGFSTEYGLQEFTRVPNVVNDSYEWALLKNQAAENDGLPPVYDDYALEQFQQGGNPLYPNNNWRELLLHDMVPQKRQNLNLSGSAGETGDVRYFVNVGMLDQGGQWKVQQEDYDPSSYLRRYNFRSNIDANLSESLKAFLNVAGYLEKINSPNADAFLILAAVNQQAPVVPGPLTPDGEVMTFTSATQPPPYGYINRSGYRQETRSNVIASFGMEQDLSAVLQGLSAKLMGSFDTRSNYRLTAGRGYEQWVVNEGPDGNPEYQRLRGENSSLSLNTGTSFESKSNFQLFLNYHNTFAGKHEIKGLLFGQKEQLIRPNDRLPFNLIGVSSRVTYGYDDKYFLEVNAGYNGSEQFSKGNRFGFLPSVSAGWLISGEDFLQDNPVLTHLKVRTSYGLVGNDRLGGRRFLYLDDIQSNGGGYSPSLEGTISENFIGNPDIQWEVAKKANLGLEIGLYNELNLSVDLFREYRDNVLIDGSSSAPVLNGLPLGALPPANTGQIKNQGYEIVLDYMKAFSQNFSLISKINFNYASNEIEYITEPKRPGDYAYPFRQTGFPIGQQFGYIVDGYFNSQEEIDDYAVYDIGKAPRPGDFRYRDVNGDNVIDDKDMAPIGFSNVPEYTFGASFSVNYKNFDFSFMFQGVANVSNYVPDAGWGVYEHHNFYDRHSRAWTPVRAEEGQPIDYPALSLSTSSSEVVPNSFFIERTDYIRLKNAEIGYTLPLEWSGVIGSKKARVYVNGVNLLTWDKMSFKDYDPELAGSLRYPIYRVVNFGFNVVF